MKKFAIHFKEVAKSNYAILLFATVFYVIHFCFFHGGYFGFDDIEYCKIATSWIHGNFEHTSLYDFRYATIVPLYFNYLIFGINDFANFFSGFVIFILLLSLLLYFINRFSATERWCAALTLIFAPLHLLYVEKPMPDIAVELGFLLSFTAYFHQRFAKIPYRFAFLFWSLGIIIAFLAKETFLIFYPYFLVLFIVDFAQKRNRNFWIESTAILLVFGIVWLAFNQVVNEYALARIHNVFGGQYVSECSYELLPISATVNRVFIELPTEFIRALFLFPLPFALLLFPNKNSKFIFVAASYISLLLLANFMTISYTHYVPLCPDIRHFLFVLPLGSIIFGLGFRYINLVSARRFWLILLSFIGLQLFSILKHYENTCLFYIPLIIAICLARFNKKRLMMPFILFAFISIFAQNSRYNKSVDYRSQKALNDFIITEVTGKKYVFSDAANIRIGAFHAQFDTTKICFIDYKEFNKKPLSDSISQYIIENGMTLFLSKYPWELLPEKVKNANENLPVVYQNKTGKVYRLK